MVELTLYKEMAYYYDYLIKFKSDKKIRIHGIYGIDNVRKQIDNCDLTEFKIKDSNNLYLIPLSNFLEIVKKEE